MRIEKDNIVIRKANINDAPILNKWWNDGRVMDHAGFPDGLGQSLTKTINEIKRWEHIFGELCIIEIGEKAIGELNYKINDDGIAYPGWKICDFDYQNQGYGTKIILMLFEFLFTDEKINNKCSINEIKWDTMLENKRAQHVYEEKIKARKTGIKEHFWQDQKGNWRSSLYYAISREEFYNAK